MLFQNSIIAKYLKTQPDYVGERYEAYKDFFFNAERQANIKSSKEEQFQEGFLRELFVKILGYTINPDPDFNLTTEYKNAKDSRKADAAILLNGNPIGVIELKDHKTRDLRAIETQAFGYKNNNKGVRYIVISNFEQLRFYVDDAVDCEEFDLFNLSEKDFRKLYLCLAHENIVSQIPLKLKEESVSEEKSITNALYKDYSVFKRELFKDICEKNADKADKLTLFRKTQKLLDRLLFIFFAEDRGLIPPNMIAKIIEDVKKLRELDMEVSLYERFKKYFTYLDKGYKGKDFEIFAYNGGLFKTDELLDSLDIDDNLLATHSQKLSDYDFESDVSVDILGHIFEHSLSEIEEIQNEINGVVTDAKTSKRKKDGVFYTPAYITKYIVENTVGTLCKNKKEELGLSFDDSSSEVVTSPFSHVIASEAKQSTASRKKMIATLDTYREWLLGLTIVDPACGSGAFLNAAMQFLIAEHKAIDVAKAHIYEKGDAVQLALSDIETQVLEKNIYGVDINDESVEIAKLSLWLHTAQPGRKLNNLNNNIKCGNSLISDPEVAGDKAFDWEKEFPEVFAKGGFDVVIGNPPYLRVQGLRENFEKESNFYEKNYKSATERFDFYVLFMERGFHLLNSRGKLSFILPHKFLNAGFGIGIRQFIYENHALEKIVHFGAEQVFEEASVYTCVITLSTNNDEIFFLRVHPQKIGEINSFEKFSLSEISPNTKWNFSEKEDSLVLDKINRNNLRVKDLFKGVFQGIVSGDNKAFYLYDCEEKGDFIEGLSLISNERVKIEKDLCKPIFTGKTISRYRLKNRNECIIYPYHLNDGKTVFFQEDEMKRSYPFCFNYFHSIKNRLETRGSESMNYPIWFALWNARSIFNLEIPKILTPDVCFGGSMVYDDVGCYHNDTSYGLVLKEPSDYKYKAYLAILNSKIAWYFLSKTGTELRGGYFRFKTKYLEPFPIPELDEVHVETLSVLAEKMQNLNKTLDRKRNNFLTAIKAEFDFEKTAQTLEKIDEYDFKTFLAELKKAKANVSASQKIEWAGTFTSYKQECNELSQKIAATDHEIDQKVYALYGLTADEIAIVENK